MDEADRMLDMGFVHPVDKGRKCELLTHLINEGKWKQVLVFTRTKHGANRLSGQLEKVEADKVVAPQEETQEDAQIYESRDKNTSLSFRKILKSNKCSATI